MPEVVSKEIEKRKKAIGVAAPIVVDIGGEDKYSGAFNVNVGAVYGQNQTQIPNVIAGVYANEKLPFLNRSVTKITIENTLGFLGAAEDQAAKEIARIIKPGGKMSLYGPDNAFTRKLFIDFWKKVAANLPNGVFSAPNPPLKRGGNDDITLEATYEE